MIGRWKSRCARGGWRFRSVTNTKVVRYWPVETSWLGISPVWKGWRHIRWRRGNWGPVRTWWITRSKMWSWRGGSIRSAKEWRFGVVRYRRRGIWRPVWRRKFGFSQRQRGRKFSFVAWRRADMLKRIKYNILNFTLNAKHILNDSTKT